MLYVPSGAKAPELVVSLPWYDILAGTIAVQATETASAAIANIVMTYAFFISVTVFFDQDLLLAITHAEPISFSISPEDNP